MIVLSLGGAAAGYLLGTRAGADLDHARAQKLREGERQAPGLLHSRDRRRAIRAGETEGYRAAYGRGYRAARERTAATGPQACGDAQSNETLVVIKLRAQGIGCETAVGCARDSLKCRNLEQSCNGTPIP